MRSRHLVAFASLGVLALSCGPRCADRFAVHVEVSGLTADAELRVTLTSDGLADSATSQLVIGEDGTFPFLDDLECGAAYELAIESEPEGRRCRLASSEGTAGPGRVHVLECLAEPAACAGLFVEPTRIVDLEEMFGGALAWPDPGTFMTSLVESPSEPGVWFAGAMQGAVSRFDGAGWTEVLDVRSSVDATEEDGFLSIVLAPGFPGDPRLFVQYVVEEPDPRRVRVSRFVLGADGVSFDRASELPILEVPKSPMRNSHAGGTLLFGPDGMLWGSIGDGGVTSGTPPDNAQDTSTLLGAMFRVDVSGPEPYVSPPDNPFGPAGERPGEGAPEMWAWGLRNPYRWSFDPLTGEAWGGDVGQLTWEEINHYERGGNYGWPVREGPTCRGTEDDDCPSEGLTPPVHAYAQEVGDAVIGGVVYRGSSIPELYGAYLFADFGSRRLSALLDPYGTPQLVELAALPLAPVTFAVDSRGEVLVGGLGGAVVRLVPGDRGEELPSTLDATGCVTPSGELVDAFVAYDVASPLWSDGADKRRWIALPPGERASVDVEGRLVLPVGSVLAKEFSLDGRLLETRFLIHRAPGRWDGHSYRWAVDGSSATRVTESTTENVGGQEWFYPGPGDCASCHTEAAGRSLGTTLSQLARDVDVDGTPSAQLPLLAAAGVLDDPGPVTGLPAIDDASAPPEDRARAYLSANCAHCHRPDHPIRVSFDLRYGVPLSETGLCAPTTLGDFGIAGAQRLAPGDPDRSILVHRMESLGPERMPRLATSVVDTAAVTVVRSWIEALAGCD